MLGRWIDKITSDTRFGAWIDGIMDKVVALINKIREWISLVPGLGALSPAQDLTVSTAADRNAQRVAMGLPALASGGIAPGGLALVGERGPELVNLPRGAYVHSNADSQRMMGGNADSQRMMRGNADSQRMMRATYINVSMNGVTVREQADVGRIARELGRRVDSKLMARGLRPLTA
jgi:hypothetical protein